MIEILKRVKTYRPFKTAFAVFIFCLFFVCGSGCVLPGGEQKKIEEAAGNVDSSAKYKNRKPPLPRAADTGDKKIPEYIKM